jgi:hypothetical protein
MLHPIISHHFARRLAMMYGLSPSALAAEWSKHEMREQLSGVSLVCAFAISETAGHIHTFGFALECLHPAYFRTHR